MGSVEVKNLQFNKKIKLNIRRIIRKIDKLKQKRKVGKELKENKKWSVLRLKILQKLNKNLLKLIKISKFKYKKIAKRK